MKKKEALANSESVTAEVTPLPIERDRETYPLEGVIEFDSSGIRVVPKKGFKMSDIDEHNKWMRELDFKCRDLLGRTANFKPHPHK